MRALLVAMVLPAFALQADDGEKLFNQQSKKIAAAMTLRLTFDAQVFKDTEEFGKFHGSLDLGGGDKGRMEMKGTAMGKDIDLKMECDGKTLKTVATPPGKEKEEAIPKNFGRVLRAAVSRIGVTAGLLFHSPRSADGKQEDLDLEKALRVSDFKLGDKAKVGGREARVVEYKVTLGDKAPLAAKVWLDAKTHLPLKRELSAKEGGAAFRIVETYSEFKLAPQADTAPK